VFFMRETPEAGETLTAVVAPAPKAIPIAEDLDWRLRARCRGVDPIVFHPAEADPGDEAKVICALCPVKDACLDHALAAREKDGVWGGMTAIERRRLIRRMRRSA
jgi:WhiB family redox-sensing transcriptional regulator